MWERRTRISLTLNPGYEPATIPTALPPLHRCSSLPGPGHCIRIVFGIRIVFATSRALELCIFGGSRAQSARLRACYFVVIYKPQRVDCTFAAAAIAAGLAAAMQAATT